MTSKEQNAMQGTPLSHKQRESAAEVFDQYEGLDRVAAWVALKNRAFETNRPFRVYDCAHEVATALMRKK